MDLKSKERKKKKKRELSRASLIISKQKKEEDDLKSKQNAESIPLRGAQLKELQFAMKVMELKYKQYEEIVLYCCAIQAVNQKARSKPMRRVMVITTHRILVVKKTQMGKRVISQNIHFFSVTHISCIQKTNAMIIFMEDGKQKCLEFAYGEVPELIQCIEQGYSTVSAHFETEAKIKFEVSKDCRLPIHIPMEINHTESLTNTYRAFSAFYKSNISQFVLFKFGDSVNEGTRELNLSTIAGIIPKTPLRFDEIKTHHDIRSNRRK